MRRVLEALAKTCAAVADSIWKKPSSTAVSLLKKRGAPDGQNQAGKRNQNHGCYRPPRSSDRGLHRKRYATPSEAGDANLAEIFVEEPVQRLIGDNAYDSDQLDRELAETGVEMIAPHRCDRANLTQDGRPLRRYRGHAL
jgi:hypothetical protein